MYLRVIEKKEWNETIVAICDAELIGRVLREGEVTLDLERYKSFYVGEKVGAEEAARELKKATTANLVGEKAVGIALKLGLATSKQVKTVEKIPHLQLYRV